MRWSLAVLTVAATCSVSLGQNLLVNPSFQDPAFARIQITGTIADGDALEIGIGGGATVAYEFDDNDTVTEGRTPVDVSGGLDEDNAATQLANQINADLAAALVPFAAATDQVNDPDEHPDVFLTWDGSGGDGEPISVLEDANSKIDADAAFNAKCRQNHATILGWEGNNDRRNGDVFTPGPWWDPTATCPDGERATLQAISSGELKIYQSVSGLTASTSYLLKGVWTIGATQGAGQCEFRAELRDGATADAPVIQEVLLTLPNGGKYNWLPFAVSGAPTGTDLTLVLRVTNAGTSFYAMHLDDLSLEVATCAAPTVTAFAEPQLAKGSTYQDVQVTGSGFVAGQTTVYLAGDDTDDIVATDVQVLNSNTLTCDFAIPNTSGDNNKQGRRAVVVKIEGCGGAALLDATEVIRVGTFVNGSFEIPPVTGGCPVTPQAAPWYWESVEINGYGGTTKLFRDLSPNPAQQAYFVPTCPPPDGVHYAGTTSDNNGGTAAQDTIYQTVQVTAGTVYTLSGYFAGGGNNTVEMQMIDGSVDGALLASAQIHGGAGSYDWTFNAISAAPTGTVMTIAWRVRPFGAAPHAFYMDAIALQPCTNPISVTSIEPSSAVNTGPISIANLAGTGLEVGATPKVVLTGPGVNVEATNVHVVDGSPGDNYITCDLDVTGLPSGQYDVIVVQNGCVAKLSDATQSFVVIATGFANGSFEDPSAPANCGGDTWGTPTGWSGTDSFHRDGSVYIPGCSPLPDGDHYGSLSNGEGAPQRAWQTIEVGTGSHCTFSGYFAGGGMNTVEIKLLDGDENGQPIASTVVWSGGQPPNDAYLWTFASVEGSALSNVITVMWELSNLSGVAGAHADNLTLDIEACHDPFADVDGDGDVDQSDFAILQICFTGNSGTIPGEPQYCTCLNRNPAEDQVVDAQDVLAFEACASGPGIAADPGCDD